MVQRVQQTKKIIKITIELTKLKLLRLEHWFLTSPKVEYVLTRIMAITLLTWLAVLGYLINSYFKGIQ